MRRACLPYARALTRLRSTQNIQHRRLGTTVETAYQQPLPLSSAINFGTFHPFDDVSATLQARKRGIIDKSRPAWAYPQVAAEEDEHDDALRREPAKESYSESEHNAEQETSTEEERKMMEEAVWQSQHNNNPDELSSNVMTKTALFLSDNMAWLRFRDPSVGSSLDQEPQGQAGPAFDSMDTIAADDFHSEALTAYGSAATDEEYLQRLEWRFIDKEYLHRHIYLTWRDWVPKYLGISMRYDTSYDITMREKAGLWTDPKAEQWAIDFGFTSGKFDKIAKSWFSFNWRKPRFMWVDALLWTMWHHPEHVPTAVWATYDAKNIPQQVYLDIAQFMAESWWSNPEQASTHTEVISPQVDFILNIMSRTGAPKISQKLVWLLVDRCSHAQLTTLLQVTRGRLRPMTMLHLTQALGRFGDYTAALEEISYFVKNGYINTQDKRLCQVLTFILRNSMVNPDGYHANAQIVQQIVDLGIVVDTKMQTALMINAVDAGDPTTAIRMYHFLQARQQIRLDDYVFATIGLAARRANSRDLLREIVQQALQAGQMNDFLAGEILISFYKLLRSGLKKMPKAKQRTAYVIQETVRIYCELFTPEPLLQLGIISASQIPDLEACATRKPSCNVLNATISMLWRERQPTPAALTKTWSTFRHRLLDMSPTNKYRNLFAGLTTDQGFHNLLLVAARSDHRLLELSTEIVRDMALVPPEVWYISDGSIGEKMSPSRSPRMPPVQANTKTWSILMSSFERHGQHEAARRVLSLMRQKGEEPDEVTWVTLTKSYLANRDGSSIVDIVREQVAHSGGPERSRSTGELLSRVGHVEGVQALMELYLPVHAAESKGDIKVAETEWHPEAASGS